MAQGKNTALCRPGRFLLPQEGGNLRRGKGGGKCIDLIQRPERFLKQVGLAVTLFLHHEDSFSAVRRSLARVRESFERTVPGGQERALAISWLL